jgi:putative transposase
MFRYKPQPKSPSQTFAQPERMGIGHRQQQQSLFKTNWSHRFSHGGVLRQKKLGRGQRPLSCKEPLHLVFKVDRLRLRHRSLRSNQSFPLILHIIKKYSERFQVKIEQLSVQGDHIHILLRAPRRSRYHFFFRVVAGQIAQRFDNEGLLVGGITGIEKQMTGTPAKSQQTNSKTSQKNAGGGSQQAYQGSGTKLWKYRPFTRVVRGWRANRIVRDYIQLNEKEICGKIPYQKARLRGLSNQDWQRLWG